MTAPIDNPDQLRVILTSTRTGAELNRTTLGEFLADNPDLVVDSTDIKQMIDHQGYWLWDGGAGGVFKVTLEPSPIVADLNHQLNRAIDIRDSKAPFTP